MGLASVFLLFVRAIRFLMLSVSSFSKTIIRIDHMMAM